MIKHILGLVLFACVVTSADAAGNSPFIGDWKLDPAKSTPDTMKVASLGANKYSFDFGGGPETVVVDGTDQRTELYGGGTLSVASAGGTWTVIRKDSKGRQMLSATWNISKDGRTLTDRFTGFGADGTGHTVILTYERKAEGPGFAGKWVSISEEAVGFVLELKIRPFEGDGLSIADPSSQILGNMKFAGPMVRMVDARTLETMRKKSDGELTRVLKLELSPDLKALVISFNSGVGGDPHVVALDRI